MHVSYIYVTLLKWCNRKTDRGQEFPLLRRVLWMGAAAAAVKLLRGEQYKIF